MNRNKDYYLILGINPAATQKEIKAAYRSLARKYHPDVNSGNRQAEERFKEIGEAYSVLSDENKRKQYNILRGIDISPKKSSANAGQQTKKQAEEAYTQQKSKANRSSESYKKTLEEERPFNEIFSEFLDGIFKKSATDTERQTSKKQEYSIPPKRGDDITADVSITITEAHNGTIRKVNILHTESCPICKGRRIINEAKCLNCDGNGEISNHKRVNVKIPPNVKEGSKIKIPREGNKGINGGENGDLYLVIHIQKNELFTFEGLHVLCEIPISPTEAAIGSEIQVPTIDGFVSMKIPPETQSGQKFRLAGEGVSDSSSKKGDQLVTVRIELPKNLTEKEKDLYLELARIRKFNPRENILFEK